MAAEKKCKYTGALVLGMHDALVELTGIIAGLTFAFADRNVIIVTASIAAVAASLSMAAANYQAQKTDDNPNAGEAAIYTGAMYIATSAALILPFVIIPNQFKALGVMCIMAILVIFSFNCIIGYLNKCAFIRRFFEMLGICSGVAIASFAIGQAAKYFLGVNL